MIGSIVAIAIGTMLWAIIGPAVVLMGMLIPRISGNHEWASFEAYSWLSHGMRAPSIAEISSTYWLGFAISIIGLSILAAGVTGIIFVAVMEMRA
jgi:hypothetical protein